MVSAFQISKSKSSAAVPSFFIACSCSTRLATAQHNVYGAVDDLPSFAPFKHVCSLAMPLCHKRKYTFDLEPSEVTGAGALVTFAAKLPGVRTTGDDYGFESANTGKP